MGTIIQDICEIQLVERTVEQLTSTGERLIKHLRRHLWRDQAGSYADQLLSHAEILSCGPKRHSALSKAETS